MGTRCAAYCRISDDKAGQGLGVDDQAADCTALADTLGWTITQTFTDNDLSAYSGKIRPAYERMMAAVRAGNLDAIVAVHPDRLHRAPIELETFICDVDAAGVAVRTVRAGHWDLTTPAGRMTARQLGSVARYESENKAERVRRAMERNAKAGISHGRCPYGWRRIVDEHGRKHDVIDPAQADIVRELARRILAGDSLTELADDMTKRGVPAPTSRPWNRTSVRALVERERNVAQRVHQGVVIGDGAWDPILTDAVYAQVKAVLHDPKRLIAVGSKAIRLLSGIARCSVCGEPVWVRRQHTGACVYRCRHGHIGKPIADVDGYVTEVIVERLSRPDVADLFAPDRADDVRAAQAEAKALQDELDAAYRTLSVRGASVMEKRLLPLLEDAQARGRAVDDVPLFADLVDTADVGATWAVMSLSRRRAVIDTLVNVRLHPGRKGSKRFDPTTVEITWKS